MYTTNPDEEIIGIDLGTSNSIASYWKDGKYEIIPNDFSNDGIIPSFVYFNPDDPKDIIIGDSAKAMKDGNPKNVIYNIKRIIGRKFGEADGILEKEMKNLPYIILNKDNKPIIEIPYKNGEKKYFEPEDISAIILKNIKENAEKILGYKIEKAVITIPKGFSHNQRVATQEAAKKAGFKEVLRLINEPAAASLAYGLQDQLCEDQKCLVFDLGAGTLDIDIINIIGDEDVGKIFDVISHGGDQYFGGEDFTREIEKYIMNHGNSQGFAKLYSEDVKIDLSKEDCTYLKSGEKFERKLFEELNKDNFEKCIKEIDKTLLDCNLKTKDINCVILIGGSTKIPKISKLLKEKFNDKDPYINLDQNKAVSIGAGILASKLTKKNSFLEKINLLDSIAISIGIEIYENKYKKVIKKNSHLPCYVVENFETCVDYQEYATFNIYEGENENECNKNHLMGSFTIKNLPKKKKGEVFFSLLIDVDESSIIYVRAIETSNNLQRDLYIVNDNRVIEQSKNEELKKEFQNLIIKTEIQQKDLELVKNKKCLMNILAKKYKESKEEKYEINYLSKLIKVIFDFINEDILLSKDDLKKEMYQKFKIYLEILLMYLNKIYNIEILKNEEFNIFNIENILSIYCFKREDIFNISEDYTDSLLVNYFSLILEYSCLELLEIINKFQMNKKFYLKLLNNFVNGCIEKGEEKYNNKEYKKCIEFLKYAKDYIDLFDLFNYDSKYLKMLGMSNKIIAKEKFDEAKKNYNNIDEGKELIIHNNFKSSLNYYLDAYKYMERTEEKEFLGECLYYIVIIPFLYINKNNINLTQLALLKSLITKCISNGISLPNNEKIQWYKEAQDIQKEIERQYTPIELEKYFKKKYRDEFIQIDNMSSKNKNEFIEYILKNYCPEENLKEKKKTLEPNRFLTILRAKYSLHSNEVNGTLCSNENDLKKIYIYKKILQILNNLLNQNRIN